ncbi:MAG: nucleotidyltransferase domain-containing protein [bacterium]
MYTPKIALTKSEIEFLILSIRNVLGENTKILIFGSRVRGTARKFSDVDIAVTRQKPIPSRDLTKIKEEINNSKFRYLVDIVDLNSVSAEFRKVVEETGVEVG